MIANREMIDSGIAASPPSSSAPQLASASVSSFRFYCLNEDHGLLSSGWDLVQDGHMKSVMVHFYGQERKA